MKYRASTMLAAQYRLSDEKKDKFSRWYEEYTNHKHLLSIFWHTISLILHGKISGLGNLLGLGNLGVNFGPRIFFFFFFLRRGSDKSVIVKLHGKKN